MLTFRPIVYSDDDLRAFKYTGTDSVREGAVCYAKAGDNRNQVKATLFNGTISTLELAGGAQSGTILSQYAKGKYFIIYHEDLDIDSVGATIDQNDWVVSMFLRGGNEFEVHGGAMHSNVASFSTGSYVNVGTMGKLCAVGGASDSGLTIGQCIGTYNNWLRVQII